MSYNHLNLEERHYISTRIKNGVSLSQIAKELKRSQSSISREVKRNTGKRGYRHKQANEIARQRQTTKTKRIKLTEPIISSVKKYLSDEWSPEQIVGRLKVDGIIDLHHETLYRYILRDKKAGGLLYLSLRHQNKTYRKRYGTKGNRSGIPNRRDIDERPSVANNRERVGDWEADTMIGKNHKGVLVTLDERKSKIRFCLPVARKSAEEVSQAIARLLEPVKDYVLSITFDNGREFASHEWIADRLACDTYFAKPYQSWQRGQNENANGLLRQYFPKSMQLDKVTEEDVMKAIHKLNNRPRKCLNYRTPYEVFESLTGITREDILGVMH